jgi:hypothetical protein
MSLGGCLTVREARPLMSMWAAGARVAPTRALQAYLGHRNIQHTVRYTELAPTGFKDFWR